MHYNEFTHETVKIKAIGYGSMVGFGKGQNIGAVLFFSNLCRPSQRGDNYTTYRVYALLDYDVVVWRSGVGGCSSVVVVVIVKW